LNLLASIYCEIYEKILLVLSVAIYMYGTPRDKAVKPTGRHVDVPLHMRNTSHPT
jgi:hypothetical protein